MSTGVRCKVFQKKYTSLFLLTCSCILLQEIASQKSCAYFTFGNSTVPTNSIEVTENMTLTLLFYLKTNACSNMVNTTIYIERLDRTTKRYTPQCDLVLKKGTCRNTKHEHTYCWCQNTFGTYTFSKIINKSDITWWKWTTKDGLAENVYVWFNETHTDWQFASRSTIGDQTSILSSKEHTTDEESERVVTVTVLVTTDVSLNGESADGQIWIFVTIALLPGLLIIVISLVHIMRVKKAVTSAAIQANTNSPDADAAGRILQIQQYGHINGVEPGQNRIVDSSSFDDDDDYLQPPCVKSNSYLEFA